MIQTDAMEKKRLDLAMLERKGPASPARYRVPTGDVEARVFARRVEDGSHGVVPVLDLRTFRRSPSEPSDKDDAFHPTAAGVTVELRLPGADRGGCQGGRARRGHP